MSRLKTSGDKRIQHFFRADSHGSGKDGAIAERLAEACNEHEWGEPGLNLAYAFYETV